VRKHALRLTATLLPIILICFAIGAAGVAYGLYNLLGTRAFLRNATAHVGIVVDLTRRSVRANESAGTKATTRYTVAYKTADDSTAYVTSRVSSHPPVFEVGDHVQVLVARDENGDRTSARIDTLKELYGVDAAFLFAGLAFTLAATTSTLFGWRQMWREIARYFRMRSRR
jgi:hypothetical protein